MNAKDELEAGLFKASGKETRKKSLEYKMLIPARAALSEWENSAE